MTQDKNINTERMKRVTIISNENMYKLSPFSKKSETRHRDTMIEFIVETGVPVIVTDGHRMLLSSQEIAYNLTEQGFCVLLYNKTNDPATLTIYLPEELGVEQREHLNLAISKALGYQISVLILNKKEELFDYMETIGENKEQLLSFINTIPNSLKVESNKLTRKKKNSDN